MKRNDGHDAVPYIGLARLFERGRNYSLAIVVPANVCTRVTARCEPVPSHGHDRSIAHDRARPLAHL
jgi:hypothetical protein